MYQRSDHEPTRRSARRRRRGAALLHSRRGALRRPGARRGLQLDLRGGGGHRRRLRAAHSGGSPRAGAWACHTRWTLASGKSAKLVGTSGSKVGVPRDNRGGKPGAIQRQPKSNPSCPASTDQGCRRVSLMSPVCGSHPAHYPQNTGTVPA